MDPQTCLYEIMENIQAGNREDVVEGLDNLVAWIDRGGFLPQVKKDHNPRSWWIPREG